MYLHTYAHIQYTYTSSNAYMYSYIPICITHSVLKCESVCCSVLQCVAVCCSVLQCVAVCCSVLQCVAVCCSVLQCAAVCCSMLRCIEPTFENFYPSSWQVLDTHFLPLPAHIQYTRANSNAYMQLHDHLRIRRGDSIV